MKQGWNTPLDRVAPAPSCRRRDQNVNSAKGFTIRPIYLPAAQAEQGVDIDGNLLIPFETPDFPDLIVQWM